MDLGGTAASPSSTDSGSSAALEPVEPPLKHFKFLQQQFTVSHPQSSAVDVSPETELSNYAAELCHGSVTNYGVLKGTLSKVALDLLSAPASQAYTERLLSVCGDLTAGKCERMTSSLERCVFLRLNLKYHE